MADEYRMALTELLRKAQMDGDVDFLKEGVRVLSQAVMEMEVSRQLGAERYESPRTGCGTATVVSLGHEGWNDRTEGAEGA